MAHPLLHGAHVGAGLFELEPDAERRVLELLDGLASTGGFDVEL